jgi:hypothetical protein
MHHIMMLWQHLDLLPTLVVQGYQHSLPNNIILLEVHDLNKIWLVDLVIYDGHVKVFHRLPHVKAF